MSDLAHWVSSRAMRRGLGPAKRHDGSSARLRSKAPSQEKRFMEFLLGILVGVALGLLTPAILKLLRRRR